MLYRHTKTGNIYRHLAFGRDCTNDRDGTLVEWATHTATLRDPETGQCAYFIPVRDKAP